MQISSRQFCEMFEVLASFVGYGDFLGPAWNCSNAFRYIQMRVDTFGCIPAQSQILEKLPPPALLASAEALNGAVYVGGPHLRVGHLLNNIKS